MSQHFQNGRNKALSNISRLQNAVTLWKVDVGKTLFYKGREMDVVRIIGDVIVLDNDGEEYRVRASDSQLKPGTCG